ncbi:MAG: Holliday junction resolvase RuvX [bacterium]
MTGGPTGRILAIDLGTKRIGIALSDPTAMIATPLETLTGLGERRAAAHVAELCRRHDVAAVIVGWPRNMDASRGPAARQAEAFADRLRTLLPVPVELWDERLSTAAAERALIEADVRREERRRSRDRVAAALILQGYLDARRTSLGQIQSGHNEERS